MPERYLKILNSKELELHEVVMDDRNTMLAHSDSAAWNLKPEVMKIGDSKILIPWANDTTSPLTKTATKTFKSMSKKLMDRIFKERRELEKELIDYLGTE